MGLSLHLLNSVANILFEDKGETVQFSLLLKIPPENTTLWHYKS